MKHFETSKQVQQYLYIIVVTLFTSSTAFAAPAQTPLELQQISAKPNVMLLLDNSGSMTSSVTGSTQNRMQVAKDALSTLIDNNNSGKIRFCGATFSHYNDIFRDLGTYYNSFGAGAYMDEGMQCGSSSTSLNNLKTSLNAIVPDGGTPLAEAYYDVTRYFRHKGPYFGLFENGSTRYAKHSQDLLYGTSNNSGTAFADPIQYACQSNTVVVITDGLPTTDWDAGLNRSSNIHINDDSLATTGNPKLPNWDSDQPSPPRHDDNTADWLRHRYIDDLAKFGQDIDFKNGGGFDSSPWVKQNLKTHVIGFGVDGEVLSDTAAYGNGNYYQATNPTQLANSLQDALDNVVISGTGEGAGSSGVTLVTGPVDYYVTAYDTDFWSGDLISFALSENNTTGDLQATENWKASQNIPAHANRKIFTRKYRPSGAANTRNIAVDFLPSSLTVGASDEFNAEQKAALGADVTEQTNVINYIRGDLSNAHTTETNDDTDKIYRYRRTDGSTPPLGDIVHSTPKYVQNEVFNYPDMGSTNTYSDYKVAQKNRTPVVYVGANDGMLHAFNADTGVEMFGYIPDTVIANLQKLADINYDNNHRYFIDGTPNAIDAKVKGDWSTVYSSPFGAGAKGLFNLNITDPNATIDNLLMWEANQFTPVKADGITPMYPEMGNIFTRPKIGRILDQNGNEKWILITGNGVDSVDGKSYVYVMNLNNGTLRQKIRIPGLHKGSPTPTDNGVTSVVATDLDNNSFIDRLYATTLEGKVWRLDYDATAGTKGKFVFVLKDGTTNKPLFEAINNDGDKQPITAEVTVTRGPDRMGHLVSFGTGKFFEEGDFYSNETQSFYNVWDQHENGSTSFTTLTRSNLVEQEITNSVDGQSRTTTSNDVDYSVNKGWYIDLPDPGERIVTKATAFFERLAFNTISLNALDSCGGDKHAWFMQAERLGGKPPVPPKAYFGGQLGKVGIRSKFSTQEPVVLQSTRGTVSYPTVDRDGNVDNSTEVDFEYYRSSWRRLQ